jgi:hypothetical protein
VSHGQEEELTDISRNAFHKEDCRIHLWTIKKIEHYRRARISQVTRFIEQYRAYWKDHIVRVSTHRIPKEDLKI